MLLAKKKSFSELWWNLWLPTVGLVSAYQIQPNFKSGKYTTVVMLQPRRLLRDLQIVNHNSRGGFMNYIMHGYFGLRLCVYELKAVGTIGNYSK